MMEIQDWLKAAEHTVHVLQTMQKNGGALSDQDKWRVEYFDHLCGWVPTTSPMPGTLLRFVEKKLRPYISVEEWFSSSAGGWRFARHRDPAKREIMPCGTVRDSGVIVGNGFTEYKKLLDEFEVSNNGSSWHRAGVLM